MTTTNQSILFTFLIVITLISGVCYLLFPDICENTAEKEVVSPNGKLKAVIFDRGCGATVGFITGISIIPAKENIQNNDAGNVLFAENVYREFSYENGKEKPGDLNFDVKWLNDEELSVFYTKSKNLSKEENYKNIKINYELISK